MYSCIVKKIKKEYDLTQMKFWSYFSDLVINETWIWVTTTRAAPLPTASKQSKQFTAVEWQASAHQVFLGVLSKNPPQLYYSVQPQLCHAQYQFHLVPPWMSLIQKRIFLQSKTVFITHPICKDYILKHLHQRNCTWVHKFKGLLIIWLLKTIIFTKPTAIKDHEPATKTKI